MSTKASPLPPFIKGSLATVYIKCGKPNCHCAAGKRHPAFYLSYRFQGKTITRHIPTKIAKQVRQFCQQWKRLNKSFEQNTDKTVKKIIHDYKAGRKKKT